MSNAPTTVLLHGAGMRSDIWDRVLPLVGTPAVALDVPGRKPEATPETCADEIADRLNEMDIGDVVLVLHSLSAVLAPDLALRLPVRLRSCVFLSGVVPPPNKAFVDALPFPNRLILRVLLKLRSNGLRPSPAMIRRELCNDLDETDTRFVVSTYEPEFPGLYLSPVGVMSNGYGVAYVKLLRDQSIPPALQDEMIARLNEARVYELDAGHLAMLSAPAALAEILQQEVAAAVRGT